MPSNRGERGKSSHFFLLRILAVQQGDLSSCCASPFPQCMVSMQLQGLVGNGEFQNGEHSVSHQPLIWHRGLISWRTSLFKNCENTQTPWVHILRCLENASHISKLEFKVTIFSGCVSLPSVSSAGRGPTLN